MLEKLFAAIDLFGIPILLNFSKSQKAKSSFGGFCSLLFFGFVAWSIYNSGYELFAREKPSIIDGTIYSEKPRPIEASSKGLPLAFGIRTNDSLIDKQFCSYYLVFYNPANGSQSVPSEMEKCTPQHFEQKLETNIPFNISDYHCLPRNASSLTTDSVIVSVFCPQRNDTETEAFFANSPMSVALYPNNGLTLHDYKNPLQVYYDYDTIPILSDLIVMNSWSIGHLQVSTDDGWLTATEKETEYIQVTNIGNRNIQNPGIPGVIYEFKVAKQENYYLRSYKRIQNVLAEVGGIANTVFTALLIMITPYSRIKFSQAFVNELFEIQKKKGNKKRASKTPGPKTEQIASMNQKSELEMQNKKSNLQKKDSIPSKKESRLSLFMKKKVNENTNKSPQHFENEGLLKPRTNAKLTQKPKSPYRKAYTQPVEIEEHPLGQKSPEQSVLGLDDLVLKLDKSLANMKEKRKGSENAHDNFEDSESHPVESKSENKKEFAKEYHAQYYNPGAIELQKYSIDNTNKRPSKPSVHKGTERKSSKSDKTKNSEEITISAFEYFWSFISRSKSLKEKMVILKEGIKIFDERLDIFSLLRKLRDIDKIKGLLFDQDQLILFDRTSRPEIMNRANHWYTEECLHDESITESTENQITSAKQRIQDKPEKSEIDQILLDVVP